MMKKMQTMRLLNVAAVAVAFLGSVAHAQDYVPGELLVKFRDGTIRTKEKMMPFYQTLGVEHVKRLKGVGAGIEKLSLRDGLKVEDAIAEAMRNPEVEYAQPNYIFTIQPVAENMLQGDLSGIKPSIKFPCIPGLPIPGCDPDAKLPCLIPGINFPPGCEPRGGNPPRPPSPPNPTPRPPATKPALEPAPGEVNPPQADPDLEKAYGISKIGAPTAWESFKGRKDFVVAVIDTGVDYNHPDLAFNMWRNANPTEGDVTGYDFVHNDGMPFDDNEHGTHCAGVIGATGGNGLGIAGVNHRVSIMALKFLSARGSGTTADAIRAIDYGVEKGAKVLSNSWGGKGDTDNQALRESIERAKAKDVLFIAAAGNDGTSNDGRNPSYPAAFDNDNLISVAATDANDKLAFFSNFGVKTTHIAAPGVRVHSTVPKNGYKAFSGTSMAAPHVAGAAALIWANNPSMTYKQVKDALLSSVDTLPELAEKVSTSGRLNVAKALALQSK